MHFWKKAIVSQSRAYSKTAHSKSFESLYDDLSTQLFHDRLNNANRALVFRPRRAKELLSRKNPIIVEGQELKPMVYKGIPGKSDLTELLELVETPDQLQSAQKVVKGYANYQPGNIQSSHLIRYLRSASRIGHYNAAASVVLTGYEFKPIRNKQVMKEMVRIQAVRASTPNGVAKVSPLKSSLFRAWQKVPQKSQEQDLDVNLSLLYGLTGLIQNAETEAQAAYITKKAKGALENVKKILASQVEIPEQGLPAFIIDLSLGIKALQTLGAESEATQIKEILSTRAASSFKNIQGLVDSYEKEIQTGYQLEHPSPSAEESPASETTPEAAS